MRDWLKKLFQRNVKVQKEVHPLRIEGTHTTLTADPDDAELAAQALLESLATPPLPPFRGRGEMEHAELQPEEKGTAYYRRLADRIRQAHDAAILRTIRFLAFCEQELQKPNLPKEGPGSLGLLEAELYKRIDTVDREGGELKRRWQHCLAEVTVRLMEEEAHPQPLPKGGENKAATQSQYTET